jgi:hypothetical protein
VLDRATNGKELADSLGAVLHHTTVSQTDDAAGTFSEGSGGNSKIAAGLSEALDDFIWIVDECHDLIEAGQMFQQTPDYAGEDLESPIAASVVVLTVAGWQAYVEEISRVVLHAVAASAESEVARGLILGHEERIERLRTPNASNSGRLLEMVGFNVETYWTWEEAGRRVDAAEVGRRINEWVAVRHRAAHGRRYVAAKQPMPGYAESRECVDFFHRVAVATYDGIVATTAE